MKCYFCKKKTDKLYELRGWKVCWDCYFEDVDKEERAKAKQGGE
jgi:hypothetical protein